MNKDKLNKSNKTSTGQPKDEIKIRPKDEIQEAKGKSAVITFGRMNPPTVGHQALVEKIIKTARAQKATPLIFLSHSFDPKKNPLSYDEKLRLAQAAFGRNIVVKSPAKNIIDALKGLQGTFDNVTAVVGSDRVPEFKRILETYNGKLFKFKSVNVVSAGTRDPDAEGVEGMSASKMRELAKDGNLSGFKKGLPTQISHLADMVMQMVRAGMKLQEELEREGLNLDEAVLSVAQRRKKALMMRKYKTRLKVARERQSRRMAGSSRLAKRSRRAAIKLLRKRVAGQKGKSYASLSSAEKSVIDTRVQQRKGLISKLAKRLLPSVKRAEILRLSGSSKQESFDYKFEKFLSETEQFIEVRSLQEIVAVVDRFIDRLEEDQFIVEDRDMKNIIKKSEQTGISVSELVEVYREGYASPRENQTAQQSAFIALNKYISEKEVWDKPMPDKAKKGSLSPAQKAKAKARARSAGRPYPNMVDNMWASRQEQVNQSFEEGISLDTGGPASSGDTVTRLLHQKLKKSGRHDLVKDIERYNPQLKKKPTSESVRRADKKRVKVQLPDGSYAWREVKKEVQVETKGAPKGYHFTRDGKLRKGDASLDGEGGAMLRADPLDKQRKKIPPLPEDYSQQVDKRQDKEKRNMEIRHARQDAAAKVREIKMKANEQFESYLDEKMDMKKADMGDVVKDFYKSDAPQFRGKSKAKRRQMAIAAKLSAEEAGAGEEGTDKLVRNYKKDTPGQ